MRVPKKKGGATGSLRRGPTPRNPIKSTSTVIESPGTSLWPAAGHKVVGATLIVVGLGGVGATKPTGWQGR